MAFQTFLLMLLALEEALESHFIGGTDTTVSLSPDYEWVVTPGSYQLTSKGEYLLGAISDIMTYGAVLVDWLAQAMIGVKFDLNSPAN